jgi:hypothetical protein
LEGLQEKKLLGRFNSGHYSVLVCRKLRRKLLLRQILLNVLPIRRDRNNRMVSRYLAKGGKMGSATQELVQRVRELEPEIRANHWPKGHFLITVGYKTNADLPIAEIVSALWEVGEVKGFEYFEKSERMPSHLVARLGLWGEDAQLLLEAVPQP